MRCTAFVLLTLLPLAAGAQTDTDGDGVSDPIDNCTLVANADQRDSNGDFYGNFCDADLNNSGGNVDGADYGYFRAFYGSGNADADFNGDGIVNGTDYGFFRVLYGKPPGPSVPADGVVSSVTFEVANIGLNAPDTTAGEGLLILDYRVVGNAWTGISVGSDVALELDPRPLQNPPIVGIQMQFRKLTDPVTAWNARWVDVWARNTTSSPLTLQVLQLPAACEGARSWQTVPPQTIQGGETVLVHVADTMCLGIAVERVQLSGPAGLVVDRVDFNLMP